MEKKKGFIKYKTSQGLWNPIMDNHDRHTCRNWCMHRLQTKPVASGQLPNVGPTRVLKKWVCLNMGYTAVYPSNCRFSGKMMINHGVWGAKVSDNPI